MAAVGAAASLAAVQEQLRKRAFCGPPDELVACPCCQQMVPYRGINQHLDQQCAAGREGFQAYANFLPAALQAAAALYCGPSVKRARTENAPEAAESTSQPAQGAASSSSAAPPAPAPSAVAPAAVALAAAIAPAADVPPNNASCGDSAGGGAKPLTRCDDFVVGGSATLVGLDKRADLIGTRVTLLAYRGDIARWRVRLQDGQEKLVASANLQPADIAFHDVPPEPAADASPTSVVEEPVAQLGEPAGDSREDGLLGADAAQSSDDSAATGTTVPEVVSPDLQGLLSAVADLHRRSFEEADDKASAALGHISSLRRSLEEGVSRNETHLAQYPNLGQPTNYEELRAKNEVRRELETAAREANVAIEDAMAARQAPAEALELAERAVLNLIDESMNRLLQARKDVERAVAERRATAQEASETRHEDFVAMAVCAKRLDGFVQQWSQEVIVEAAEGNDVYREQIEQLREEERRYVRANDSPERNPAFAKVRKDVAFASERLEEQVKRGERAERFLSSWDAMRKKLPQVPVAVTPPGPRRLSWFLPSAWRSGS
eukprot:TRINITY_DN23173_c2_g1_i1.p1 TRINITY_DN23173_c2_g1~~TRINITY_DN23173_c2_g1_i1.p1  ORF type:complete len:590 (-),score=135.72 TRINITY_DN23173_c2_g1_i1:75-1727(-)